MTAKELAPPEPFWVSVVHDTGIILEGSIESAYDNGDGDDGYVVRTSMKHPITGKTIERAQKYHRRKVLPFGFEAPSVVFGRIGRHTNKGIVSAINEDTTYSLEPVGEANRPAPLLKIPLSTSEGLISIMRKPAPPGLVDNASLLGELRLPRSLSKDDPRPPYRCGTIVAARRFGKGPLQEATILAVNFDVTYTLEYKDDGHKEAGVLHSDLRLVNDSGPNVERVAVRDVVLVGRGQATVIQCVGKERYRVALHGGPGNAGGDVVVVADGHILGIRPLLLPLAFDIEPSIRVDFDRLDHKLDGVVLWGDVRQFLLTRLPDPVSGPLGWNPLFRSAFTELKVTCGGVRNQAGRAIAEDTEYRLSLGEFEFVVRRVLNAVA